MKTTVVAKPIHDKLTTLPIFSRNAFNMIVAKDGYELVTLCRTQSVDLVLLPFAFGQFKGAAICKSLKTQTVSPLTLMFCDDAEQAKQVQNICNDTVVGEPDPEDLVKKCARLLGVSLRSDVRILVRLRVEASSVSQTHLLLGTIVDISVSGMLVETESQVSAGDTMSAEFYLPGQPQAVALMAKVARLDERDPTKRRLGMQFLRAQDDVVLRIRQFIQNRHGA